MSEPTVPPPPMAGARSRSELRGYGIAVLASSPVAGFVLFALVATLVGEDRLEGQDAWPLATPAMFVLPAAVGLAMIVWSFTSWPLPGRRSVGAAALVVGLLAAGGVVVSVAGSTAGDANIGLGFLVLAAPALIALGVGLLLGSRSEAGPRSGEAPPLDRS
ncbi:MAG: hypothetical protein AAGA93_11065 [Actinomycetota bacterium]